MESSLKSPEGVGNTGNSSGGGGRNASPGAGSTQNGTNTEATHCPLDCPDSCALEVETDAGQLVSIKGSSTEHPDTAGFICSKVTNFARRQYHPERILTPLERTGAKGSGEFRPISWDQAMERIVERFQSVQKEFGGEAIVPFHYGGSNGYLTDSLFDRRLFSKMGASQLEMTICAAPTTAVAVGMYGKMPGVAFGDYPKAQTIVIWGANPKASNIHLVPYLRQAKKAGAFIAVVDPHLHFGASEIDVHLPILPGTDLPVALAMIAHWERQGILDDEFVALHTSGSEKLLERARDWTLAKAAEVAGVDPKALRLVADRYAEASPAVIRCGWGLERNKNGGQAVAAVLAMPALMGKFGVRGGGYTMSNGGATKLDAEAMLGPMPWNARTLNMSQMGRWLGGASGQQADSASLAGGPPVKALFVYNANPVSTVPAQNAVIEGLSRDDLFTVVHDQLMTDTALYADIVLPAVTFLEGQDVRGGYGSYVVGGVRPVIERAGESRTNMEVFQELETRLGLLKPEHVMSNEQAARSLVENLEMVGRKPDVERVLSGRNSRHDFPGDVPEQFVNTLPRTADGRAHLCPAVLGGEPYSFSRPEGELPLALITPGSAKMISSTFGETFGPLELTVHPGEGERRGLKAGDTVRVFNELAEVVCGLRLDEKVRPGVAHLPKGAWFRSAKNGVTANALCPDSANVVANGACFNDARVEFERFAEA